jgi:urease accessory protein
MEVIPTTIMPTAIEEQALLRLLQLVSPALPVGAYSYSEGLESVVQAGRVSGAEDLADWLKQELQFGAIRLEAAVLARSYDAVLAGDFAALQFWNQWLSAFRESEEFRSQSWQMGRSLLRLLLELEGTQPDELESEQPGSVRTTLTACGEPCHFAIAFSVAAAHWQIPKSAMVVGYLHSWVSNLVNAGVRLIPLGQTQGQRILLNLYPQIEATSSLVLNITDDEFYSCGWGVAIASMKHETLYSRLFRS